MFAGRYYDDLYGKEQPRNRMVPADSGDGMYYLHEVRPVLENRCVVCHGCYDAPCQLKLSSPGAIDRGASKDVVYNSARIVAMNPSRMFEDAASTGAWREQGFFPVLNERQQQTVANLDASVMYQALKLKQQHPLPDQAVLDDDFDLGLSRKQQCPTITEWNGFSKSHPAWGMPYALPGLSHPEFTILERWLGTGARMAAKPELNQSFLAEIEKWEKFLNGHTPKHQLMARYIYEHWYLAHLYFTLLGEGEFFRLVRSHTPPGEPIDRISTRRPYDDPGADRVYYRFWREKTAIVLKTHLPYALDDDRLAKLESLFLEADYHVDALPGHTPEVAGNPFIAFQEIPVSSRYRFILEEAQFTVMNFIKGPVCRGQVALNVINDHFWVFFVNPDLVENYDTDDYFARHAESLRMPNEEESNANPVKTWRTYSKSHQQYLEAKTKWMNTHANESLLNLNLIWDGDGENANAALTIFRHFDSASVVKGLVGRSPKTAWLINYSLLERIHYLLVAGYDVYGNLGHQITTRLYMDFLRMEGEFNFLALLPAEIRKSIREDWYRDAGDDVKAYLYGEHTDFQQQSGIDYSSSDAKSELFDKLKIRLQPVLNREYEIDGDAVPQCHFRQLNRLVQDKGKFASLLPQVAYLTVNAGEESSYYTVIHNNAHSNITSLFREERNRLEDDDYLTVVHGFIGDYPGAFWQTGESGLERMVDHVLALKQEDDYARFMNEFGIRRTDQSFWEKSDELHQAYKVLYPVRAGLLDYNRLENR